MRSPPFPFMIIVVFLVAGTLFIGAPCANAAAVSGQFSVWNYLRDDSVDHMMVVPTLSLTAYQLGHRDISFQTTLRGFSDIRNGESADEQIRIQRAVLIYSPRGSKWKVRAGQQWINEGVGFGNMAGLWAQFRPCPKGALTGYVGSKTARTVYLNEEDGSNTDDGLAAGLRFRRAFGRYRVGLSWYYLSKDGDVQFSGVGIDGGGKLSKRLRVRARLDMNLEQNTIETAQLVCGWDPSETVQITGELRRQTPRIFESSYFARFLEEASTNHARGAVRWTVIEDYYLTGSGYAVLAEEDVLYKVRAGIGEEGLEVGYTHWLSVAEGDMDGFYGIVNGNFSVNGHVISRTFAGFDWAKGSNSNIRPNTESQSVYFGTSYDPVTFLGITVKAEHIRDDQHPSDWRGLFGITWRFSTLAGGGQ